MKRMNITLTDDLVEFLEKKSNKSRYIAEALSEKINRERKAQLKKSLIDGYSKEKEEGRLTNDEWEAGTLDSWQ